MTYVVAAPCVDVMEKACINEYPVARHYRDSKILEIGEGTTEVQLMIIGRELGL